MQMAGNFVCFIYGMKTKTFSAEFQVLRHMFYKCLQVSIYMIYTYMTITVYYSCIIQKENYAAGIAVLTTQQVILVNSRRTSHRDFPTSHVVHIAVQTILSNCFLFSLLVTNGCFNTIISVI